MGARDVATRRLKASQALKKEDQIYVQRLEEMARMHSSTDFYVLDEPQESEVFFGVSGITR